MVRCSGAELMAGLKKRKNPLKKKEPVILEEAEVIPTMPLNSTMDEAPSVPTEVQGKAEVTMESIGV